ncbi:hypothetical protein [Eisenibacter elegans]|jgi:hypothetical protein|uniref:hypothetical protein n=1 Tax=Eisenibacter elegans TaxID=997 RepID=UPI0004127CA5|nr:hypothetical protein [Eisenibacter elegans]
MSFPNMLRTLMMALLFFGTPMLAKAQINMFQVSLESPRRAVYYAQLEALIREQKVVGIINQEYNPFTKEYKRIILWEDDFVAEVYFVHEQKGCFCVVYRNSVDEHYVLYVDEHGSLQRQYLGWEVKRIIYKEINQYTILFVLNYDSNDTGEQMEKYDVFVKDNDDCYSRHFVIEQWLKSPRPKVGGQLETIYVADIAFQEIDYEFFVIQKYTHPEQRVRTYKFDFNIGRFIIY